MRSFFPKLKPEWALRVGFGFMYLYSGFDLFFHPSNWYGFAPQWFLQIVTSVMPVDSYLRLQGIGEFIIGLIFLAWFIGPRIVSIVSILAIFEIILILGFSGIDLITFRDIGLLGGMLALASLSFKSLRREGGDF